MCMDPPPIPSTPSLYQLTDDYGGALQNQSMRDLLGMGSQNDTYYAGPANATAAPVQQIAQPGPNDHLVVFGNDQPLLTGVIGFQNGDTVTISPHQATHNLDAHATITVEDGQTRPATPGETTFHTLSTHQTPITVVVNATTFNASNGSFHVNRGVYVRVNPRRAFRGDNNRIMVAADNGTNTDFFIDTAHIRLNMHVTGNPPLGAPYNHFRALLIREFENTFRPVTFNISLWRIISEQVPVIQQRLTGLRETLLANINPDLPFREIMVAGIETTMQQMRTMFIDDLAAQTTEAAFIRDNFDALVNFVANMRSRQNAFQPVFDDTPAAIYGLSFRERGPTSPELQDFEINTVREIMTALAEIINRNHENLRPMFAEATRALHDGNPFVVIQSFLEQAQVDEMRPVLNRVGDAIRQRHAMMDRILRPDRTGELARSRQIGELTTANTDLTNQLAESRAETTRVAAQRQTEMEDMTRQLAEYRAEITRVNALRQTDTEAANARLAAQATENDKKLRELEEKLRRETEAKIEEINEANAARHAAEQAQFERADNERMRHMRFTEGEAQRFRGEAERLEAIIRANPAPAPVVPNIVVPEPDNSSDSWLGEDSQLAAQTTAALARRREENRSTGEFTDEARSGNARRRQGAARKPK